MFFKMLNSTFFLMASQAAASGYLLPPAETVAIVDALPPPLSLPSPDGTKVLFVQEIPNPSLELLSIPFLGLAGQRIWPQYHGRRLSTENEAMWIHDLKTDKIVKIDAPQRLFYTPEWSPDSQAVAFQVRAKQQMEMWIASVASGKSMRISGVRLNNTMVAVPFQWNPDSKSLTALSVPESHKNPPEVQSVPASPIIKEALGKNSQLRTYQDLLRNDSDSELFAYFATSNLVEIDVRLKKSVVIGKPGLLASVDRSPDGSHFLVKRLEKPFSFQITFDLFPLQIEIWNRKGVVEKRVAKRPLQDEIPRQGVVSGPRGMEWSPHHFARLVWVVAQDGGDPMRKAEIREHLFMWDAPFEGKPVLVLTMPNRHTGLEWSERPGEIFLHDYDRDKRWTTLSMANLDDVKPQRIEMISLNESDAYADPGNLVSKSLATGQEGVIRDGDFVYLTGMGNTPEGQRPFLDKMNLKNKEKTRIFWSQKGSFETFRAFVGQERDRILFWSQNSAHPRNLFMVNLENGEKKLLTHVLPPSKKLAQIKQEIIKYTRADGVGLSGTVYLPPDFDPKKKYPAVVWAYPLEYSDAAMAGQVRGSADKYSWPSALSPIHFALHGYVVLDGATMPVVGNPDTANDTFISQITASAQAAVDALKSRGYIDPARVVIGGHSYGAFMTANLLAHTRLFAAGIARSGAYNRTLTPFGFQGERRSLWEAPSVYLNMSPFNHAEKIKAPLLLIHGERDSNSGTFPDQSDRLFQALAGLGGNARLVVLPLEDHAYRARESVLHMLAESFAWADKYAKDTL